MAGLIHSFLEGATLPAAVRFAAGCAAMTLTAWRRALCTTPLHWSASQGLPNGHAPVTPPPNPAAAAAACWSGRSHCTAQQQQNSHRKSGALRPVDTSQQPVTRMLTHLPPAHIWPAASCRCSLAPGQPCWTRWQSASGGRSASHRCAAHAQQGAAHLGSAAAGSAGSAVGARHPAPPPPQPLQDQGRWQWDY